MPADEQERTKVKICGVTSLEDARFISGALADYVGFIFYEESPRYITPAQAGAIINWIEGPQSVGVFVNQPLDDVNLTAKQTGIDLVQLHGNESAEYCQLVEKPVIKAIHITGEATETDIKTSVDSYADVVDYLLFDTKIDGKWGGTGQTFDWPLIKNLTGGKPFFLSGGIGPDNVHRAIETVHPYAVDLSSSLESEPGIKNYELIEQFMEKVQGL